MSAKTCNFRYVFDKIAGMELKSRILQDLFKKSPELFGKNITVRELETMGKKAFKDNVAKEGLR